MTMNDTLSRRNDVLTADMAGETVMMDAESGKYYNLGAVGGRIWELLEQDMTVAALVEALTKEYAVDAETCERDILPFLDSLAGRGLLSVK